MRQIDPDTVERIFRALEKQIEVYDGKPIELAVCGGTALAALGLVMRTTKDVDVLGLVKQTEGSLSIEMISEFPGWLTKASKKVERDFDLTDNWLNLGPTSQVETGLPDGFEERLVEKNFGQYLTVHFISRLDQIHFKLYAAVDRDDYHLQDLLSLKPNEKEIELAAKWTLTQDVSEGFKLCLKDFLKRNGYAQVAERI